MMSSTKPEVHNVLPYHPVLLNDNKYQSQKSKDKAKHSQVQAEAQVPT